CVSCVESFVDEYCLGYSLRMKRGAKRLGAFGQRVSLLFERFGRQIGSGRGTSMRTRIARWASVGALVVVLWSFYMAATRPTPLGTMWILVDLTCPIS